MPESKYGFGVVPAWVWKRVTVSRMGSELEIGFGIVSKFKPINQTVSKPPDVSLYEPRSQSRLATFGRLTKRASLT
jgi:hypothetical protein